MKIQFNPDLDFQHEAINSIVDIFEGQELCQTNFTVAPLKTDAQMEMEFNENDLGIGNRLRLLLEDILKNVNAIQLRNGLKPTDEGLKPSEKRNGMNFTVEMETGTGKTYVYLRTVHELHRKYGFTKFIIVVPSIAIKEGVYKSLQITKEHFKGLYDNVQADFFVYDSQKLGQVRNFAREPVLEQGARELNRTQTVETMTSRKHARNAGSIDNWQQTPLPGYSTTCPDTL